MGINLVKVLARVLTFRPRPEDFAVVPNSALAFGFLLTWAAGIGRYWDNPRVTGLQRLGLGSVVYVLLLTGFLWLLLKPLKPENWSYRRLLYFVTLTAPPALLYAIPVERMYSLGQARTINVWFLGVVALWRVIMYGAFLWRCARLRGLSFPAALLLPLCLIVTALTLLNLERATFDLMAGIQEQGTASDEAYAFLVLLTVLSIYVAPVVFMLYFVQIFRRNKNPA